MPGSTISTDGTSRAILTFQRTTNPNEEIVLSTVQLYNNARLTIVDSRSPRYQVSPNADRIALQVDVGQVRIATTHFEDVAPYVEVSHPPRASLLARGQLFRACDGRTIRDHRALW